MAGLSSHAADAAILELINIDKQLVSSEESELPELQQRVKNFVDRYLKPILVETSFQAAVETLSIQKSSAAS